jgi:hypothetical protein
MFYKYYLLAILFSKKNNKFFPHYFSYNYRLYLYNYFKIYYPLSQIETTRGRVTRLILALGQM